MTLLSYTPVRQCCFSFSPQNALLSSLKKEKNAQLKGFVFNPLVLGEIVGGEIASSSRAKHLIPSCGRQIKPQFYWATSRCECEHGAGRFLLLLEPALTQTL